MKVLYGITSGGSAVSLLRGQLHWMRGQGEEVVLATTPGKYAEQAVRREGVAFRPIPMAREISLGADLHALRDWLRVLHEERPDVVNASTPKAGLLGMVASAFSRIPRRVYVVRGLRLEGAHGPTLGVLWAAEWLTMRLATDLVFVSESLAEAAFSRRLGRGTRAWIVGGGSSNGVDADAVAAEAASVDPGAMRDRLGLDRNRLVAGFIGRITRDKGVGTIAEAAADPALSPRWQFLAVGDVEDETLAAELDADGNVVRIGYSDEVWAVLAAVDVLVLPTLREGFPNVVLEAASVGTPTLTTRATGAIDSVIDGETGRLFDIGDAGALVRHLNALADDPGRIAVMGRAAKERVHREFVPERIWGGVREIMAGRAPSELVRRLDPRGGSGRRAAAAPADTGPAGAQHRAPSGVGG